MARDNSNKRGTVKGFIILLLVLILGLSVALVSLLPQFYLQTIEVEGNKVLSKQSIIEESDLEIDQHLFYYFTPEIKDILQFRYSQTEELLLERFPYLEEANVHIEFPSTVRIEVLEREAFAYVQNQDVFYVLDKEGRVLAIEEQKPKSDVLEIRGIFINAEQETNEFLTEESLRQFERVVDLVDLLKRNDADKEEELKISPKVSYYYPYSANSFYFHFVFEDGKEIDVQLNPSENSMQKITWFANAFEQGAFANIENGILDLSSKQNVFRPGAQVPVIENGRDE